MNAPRTRIGEGMTEFERGMLRSWRSEEPSELARRRALGLVGAGIAASTSSIAQAAAAVGATASSVAPKAATVSFVVLSKWIVAGALVAATGITAHEAGSSREVRASSPSGVAATVVAATALPPSSPARHEAPLPNEPESEPPSAEPRVAAPVVSKTTEPASTGPASTTTLPAHHKAKPTDARPPPVGPAMPTATADNRPAVGLGEQVGAIDRAESALAAGDAAEAIRRVDEYDTRFPMGVLAQEATTLRIEALVAQGKLDAATALARQFLASHPTTPHATRIRLVLGQPGAL
jgi:hypothetical protein